jgi:hypothetical protein
VPRDRGVVVQVGSVLAYRAIPLQSAYCGAKHAIQGFTESIRSELLREESAVRITMVHLPAVNTPQFSWVLSRLPKKPQPVPPIFQPEIMGEAIVWAADHPRRETTVGMRAAGIIALNKFFPGLGDRYLADAGVDGQLTEEDADPDRPANLWEPVPGDFAARGEFDAEAKEWSPHWELNKRRGWLAAAGLGAAAAAGAALALRRRR